MLNNAYGDPATTLAFDSYSSTEQDTGRTWVNGDKIYRKVITSSGAMSTGLTNYAHGITGLKRLIFYEGRASRDDANSQQVPLPYPDTLATTLIIAIVDNTNISVNVGTFWTGGGNTISDPIFILEYTKT
jgi:hypothetical protein